MKPENFKKDLDHIFNFFGTYVNSVVLWPMYVE